VTLTRIGGNTALASEVRDQAELHGLFGRGSDLGLTLLEARASEDRPDKLPENRSADADEAENRSRGFRSYEKGADAGYDNQRRNGNTLHGI
jgi:hypothetical protein